MGVRIDDRVRGRADYPAPRQGDWIAKDFRFHTGEVMPELRIHYTTVGEPTGQPVLLLHGTAGSGTGMLTRAFAGELFGPGQPLDAAKYYVMNVTTATTSGTASARRRNNRRATGVSIQADDRTLWTTASNLHANNVP